MVSNLDMTEENQNSKEQGQIRDPVQYIAELEEINRHHKEGMRLVGHEIGNRLNSLSGFPELMSARVRKLPILEEERKVLADYCSIIKKNIKQLETISTILHLSSLKHKDLIASSKQFDIEEMIKENIQSLEWDFLRNNLGISYEYNRKQEESIYIHAHEGFMTATINTILFNLLKHAPEYSLSRFGVSIQNENLEIICENLIGKSREEYGKKTGVGFYLLEMAKKQLRGGLELKSNYLDREYQHKEIIGYQDAEKLPHHDIFSLRFYIPMKELTFVPPTTKKH